MSDTGNTLRDDLIVALHKKHGIEIPEEVTQ